MATPTGQCSECRFTNSYAAINCLDCGSRLPWADVAQAKIDAEKAERDATARAVEERQKAQRAPSAPMQPSLRTTGRNGSYDGYCRHCGKGYDGHPTYCPRCGGELAASAGRNSAGALWVAVVIGALLIGWVWLGPLLSSGLDSSDPDETAATVRAFDENNIDRAQLEQEILASYNASLKSKDASATCTSISLVEASPRHFTGFATMSNEMKMDVEVTFDKSGTYIYKVGRPPRHSKRSSHTSRRSLASGLATTPCTARFDSVPVAAQE